MKKKGAIWADSKKSLENAIKDLKKYNFNEVREILRSYKLRVWYIKDGKLKSHLYTKGELDNKGMGESWIPEDDEDPKRR